MRAGGLVAIALLSAGTLTACSDHEPAAPSPSTTASAQASKSGAVLDGVYRFDFDLAKQLRNGTPSPGEPFSLRYAVRSTCDGGGCVAVGRLLTGVDFTQPAEEPVAVLDFVDGEWVGTTSGRNPCGAGRAPVLQSWSLKPGDGGRLTGLRRLAFFSVDCSGAYEQPMSAVRVGDVDPDLTMPDPAKEPPLKPSAPAGFDGRYTKSLAPKDGRRPPPDVQVNVTTTCVRNVDHCLTYVSSQPPDTGPTSAYQFQGKSWTAETNYVAKCPNGTDGTQRTHSDWVLPDPVVDPFPRITGTQREVYPVPCVQTVDSDVLMVRIGD